MRQKRAMAYLLTTIMVISMIFSSMSLAGTQDQTATPSNAQQIKGPAATAISTAADMLMNLKGADSGDYDKIKDLTLHIIDPEEKTATVDEMSSSAIRIFVFGDIAECTNTLSVMKHLTNQMRGMNAELYYLDIKSRGVGQIRMFKDQLSDGIPYYLCVDSDHEYQRKAWALAGGTYTMPLVLIVGRDQETIYRNGYPYVGNYAAYVEELKRLIQIAYPEEMPALTPYTEMVYMYPDTQRQFPIWPEEEYVYSSSDPEVAYMEENKIVAKSPGTARLTVSQGNESADITVSVIEMKENYDTEWEVLKIMNAERINNGLLPLSTLESFQKAADLRAYETSLLYEHIRPDGADISSVVDELKIESPLYSAENIAAGQENPEEVMESWMNSTGHRENILSGQHTHVGIGYQDSVWKTSWVQYFGRCRGSYTDISLVTNSDAPAEILEGGSLDELGYELRLICSTCGETRMPVIDGMCDFDPNELGDQEVTVSYLDWSDTFPLTVNKKVLVENISVTPTSLKMNRGDRVSLAARVSPENAYDPSVTWHSTNPDVASVDEDGEVTAEARGTAEIYCTAKDKGEVLSNKCAVTVVVLVDRISMDKSALWIEIGDQESIEATVFPTDADNKEVTWYSSDPEVASVDDQGVVTAVSQGTAKVYCQAQDESGTTSQNCTVYKNKSV